jgi:hypothetical protein
MRGGGHRRLVFRGREVVVRWVHLAFQGREAVEKWDWGVMTISTMCFEGGRRLGVVVMSRRLHSHFE